MVRRFDLWVAKTLSGRLVERTEVRFKQLRSSYSDDGGLRAEAVRLPAQSRFPSRFPAPDTAVIVSTTWFKSITNPSRLR